MDVQKIKAFCLTEQEKIHKWMDEEMNVTTWMLLEGRSVEVDQIIRFIDDGVNGANGADGAKT